MKLLRSLPLAVAVAAAALVWPGRADAATVPLDLKESRISWTGKKVTGAHDGTVNFASGAFEVEDRRITSGRFVADMESLTVLDLKDPESNQKLTGHLKSADFFDAANHPEAVFVITNVEPIAKAKKSEPNVTVTGDLTIKGITNPLTFPARVDWKDGVPVARAENVRVDRTLYNIRYGSGKFFQNLGDKMIHDDFWLDLKLAGQR